MFEDELDNTLEVRSLNRIDEDSEGKEKAADEIEEQSAQLPPAIAPLSESLVSGPAFHFRISGNGSRHVTAQCQPPIPRRLEAIRAFL